MLQLLKVYGNINGEKVKKLIEEVNQKNQINIIYTEEGIHQMELIVNTKLDSIDHIIYRDLVDFIEDIIIYVYLDKTIKERILKIYMGENFEEEVISKIKSEIKTSYAYIEEKIEIRRNLLDYLMENENVDLDGYIKFRLNEYLYILDTAIDTVISDIKESKKLEEFLNIIQHFVDNQNSKINYLNVIIENDDFILKDMDNQIVGEDIIKKVKKEFSGELISKSDTLLSTLIIMSPKRLVVHSKRENSPLIKLIKDVFREKFVFCSGCNICEIDEE